MNGERHPNLPPGIAIAPGRDLDEQPVLRTEIKVNPVPVYIVTTLSQARAWAIELLDQAEKAERQMAGDG